MNRTTKIRLFQLIPLWSMLLFWFVWMFFHGKGLDLFVILGITIIVSLICAAFVYFGEWLLESQMKK